MKKINTFIRTFWKSISSLTYYQDIYQAPYSFSFKYYIGFSFLYGIMITLMIGTAIYQPLTNFVKRFDERAADLYPKELVITLENGALTTNVVEPLKIPFPFELFFTTPPAISDQKQHYLVTIDTQSTPESNTYQSLFFITRNSLTVGDETNATTYDLVEFPNTRIDKNAYDQFLAQLAPLLKLIPHITISTVAFFIIVAFPTLRLISLILLSLILVPITRALRLSLSFKKLLQLGFHAITLPTLIQTAMFMVGLFPPIPFFFSILYLLYMLAIVAGFKKIPASNRV